jgi:hypothetical protein
MRRRGGESQNTETPNLVAAIVFGGALAWGGIAATQHIPLLAPAGPDMNITRGTVSRSDFIAFVIVSSNNYGYIFSEFSDRAQ